MDPLILCKDSSLPFVYSYCQLYKYIKPKPDPVCMVTKKFIIALLNYRDFF